MATGNRDIETSLRSLAGQYYFQGIGTEAQQYNGGV